MQEKKKTKKEKEENTWRRKFFGRRRKMREIFGEGKNIFCWGEEKRKRIFGEWKNIFLRRIRTEKEKKANIMEKEKLLRDRTGGLVVRLTRRASNSDVHAFGISDLPMLAILSIEYFTTKTTFLFYSIFFNWIVVLFYLFLFVAFFYQASHQVGASQRKFAIPSPIPPRLPTNCLRIYFQRPRLQSWIKFGDSR